MPRVLQNVVIEAQEAGFSPFVRTHRAGFLVFLGSLEDLDNVRLEHEQAFHETAAGNAEELAEPSSAALTLQSLVFPLDASQDQALLTVGRLAQSDIYIPHRSVSRLQAFLQFDAERDSLFLHDGRSLNGTFINQERVPVQAEGHIRVSSGDRITFGHVELVYVDAGTLYQRLTELADASLQPVPDPSGEERQVVQRSNTEEIPLAKVLKALPLSDRTEPSNKNPF